MTTEALGGGPQVATRREVAGEIASLALRRAREILRIARPATWVLIAVAVTLWVAGQTLGWWELVVAAIVIGATLALCALFLIGRTAYDVALDLNRTHVVVGERAIGALTLANSGRRAILPSRVVLPVGGGRGVFSVGRLAAGASAEELFAIPTHRRGIVKVGPVSVVRGDPLGLFERVHRRDEPIDLFVHPRTVLFEGQSLGFLRDLEGLPATDLSPDDVSFHALREYQPGDDLRHVHWKSTARTGSVMVRQYEETRDVHVAPHAARAVEIRAAVDIEQPAAFGPLDHERLVLGHLRERVPIMAAIPIEKFVRGSGARSWTCEMRAKPQATLKPRQRARYQETRTGRRRARPASPRRFHRRSPAPAGRSSRRGP